jgi:hypothetical protein
MLAHFLGFTGAGQRVSGVFLVPLSLDVAAAIDELLLIWLASEAAEWRTGWSGCRFERSVQPGQRGW